MSIAPRKSVAKRMQDRLKGVKVPSLMKVARARGRIGSKLGGRAHSKSAVAPEKKLSEVKREAAPAVTESLKNILCAADKAEYALWLGDEFTTAFCASVKRTGIEVEALAQIAELAGEQKQAVKDLLAETKPESKDAAVEEAKELLVKTLGGARFYSALTSVLTEKLETIYGSGETSKVDVLPFKLIKALDPTVIIYNGYDRILERQFKHDNLLSQSFTALDLFSIASLSGESAVEKIAHPTKQTILKLNGDVTKPETVALTKTDLFNKYGLDAEGKKLEKPTDSAGFLFNFVGELAEKMPIVFIGESLTTDGPISHILKASYTSEKPIKHAALVSKLKDGNRLPSSETGVDYTVYTPDAEFTQITEFLSAMSTTSAGGIPDETGPEKVSHRAYLHSQAAAMYIKGVADKETIARTVSAFSNDLVSLPFVEDAKYSEDVLLPKLKTDCANAEEVAAVHEAITYREKAMSSKVLGTPAEESKTEEAPKAEGEAVAPATTSVPATNAEGIVRILVPKSAVTGLGGKPAAISKAEKLLELATSSSGRLVIRFVAEEEEFLADDFEIMFFQGEKGIGDVGLVYDQKKSFYNLSWFDINTNESEEKVLLFERMWNVALSTSASEEFLKTGIAAAKLVEPVKVVEAAPEKQGKGKTRVKRMFSKSRKDSKNPPEEIKRVANKGDELADSKTSVNGESKKGFGKRLRGLTMSRSKKKLAAMTPEVPEEALEVPKEGSKNEGKKEDAKTKPAKTDEKENAKADKKVEAKKTEPKKASKEEPKKAAKEDKKAEPKKAAKTDKKVEAKKTDKADAKKASKEEPKKAAKKAEPKKDAKKADAKKAEPKKDVKKAEPKKDAKKAEPKKDAKKAEPKKDAKKAEPKKDAKKAEPKKDAKKAEPKKDAKKADAKKAEPKKDAKKAEPKKDAKKAEPKKDAKKAEPKKDAKKADTKKAEPKKDAKKAEKKVDAKKAEPKKAAKEDKKADAKKPAKKGDAKKVSKTDKKATPAKAAEKKESKDTDKKVKKDK